MPRKPRYLNGVTFSLEKMRRMDQSELGGTMPKIFIIEGKKIPVNSWTAAAVEFVRFLFAEDLLKKHMLPFCPDSGTSKAYVNSVPRHPDAELDCKFTPVAENVYVDTKWNAQNHVSKMVKTLEKLGVATKYSISITFK